MAPGIYIYFATVSWESGLALSPAVEKEILLVLKSHTSYHYVVSCTHSQKQIYRFDIPVQAIWYPNTYCFCLASLKKTLKLDLKNKKNRKCLSARRECPALQYFQLRCYKHLTPQGLENKSSGYLQAFLTISSSLQG